MGQQQFRRVKSGVKKGNRSKSFRLAEEVRKAKREGDRDKAVSAFIRNIQQDVIALAMDVGDGGDNQLARIQRRLDSEPGYLPTLTECLPIINAAALYAELNDLDSGSLRDRLIAEEGDDLPDSLADPGEI
jgi:hypothetical protein